MANYSIIIETENLCMAENDALWDCLDSINGAIAKVEPPVITLLLNSGDVPSEMTAVLKKKYPWITLVKVPPGENYYSVKMRGVNLADSDILIFADSDCSYNEAWLTGLLTPFQDPQVQIVAGETSFTEPGPYGLALAIIHSFDGYSGKDSLYPVNNYYINNAAFRRDVLLNLPIPTTLPLYRHSCSLHCVSLRKRGEIIWMQPQSRAAHKAPAGFSHFFWRFLLFGRDRAVRAHLGLKDDAPRVKPDQTGLIHIAHKRLKRALHYQPAQWKWIPIAFVIVLFAFVLIRLGQFLARFKPQLGIDYFSAIEGVTYPAVEHYQNNKSLLGHKP